MKAKVMGREARIARYKVIEGMWQAGCGAERIAQEVGVPEGYVAYVVRSMLPGRAYGRPHHTPEERKQAVAESYEAGVVEVAARYGVSQMTVYNWRKRYKVETAEGVG
jgi:hypothetical protein